MLRQNFVGLRQFFGKENFPCKNLVQAWVDRNPGGLSLVRCHGFRFHRVNIRYFRLILNASYD